MSYSYEDFLRDYMALMERAKGIPLAQYEPPSWPTVTADSPVALIVSAHPDDEVMTGMPLGVRLRREGWRIVNLAVTLGRPEQLDRRRYELTQACRFLGIEYLEVENGVESTGHANWQPARDATQAALKSLRPHVVITHHPHDGHPDHESVNMLVRESLRVSPLADVALVEGQYWRDMADPNLMLEIGAEDFALLLKALSFHEGELYRNRYDVFWPPYTHVNARFAERVTGWGTPAADFPFSVMYKLSRRSVDRIMRDTKTRVVPATDLLSSLFM